MATHAGMNRKSLPENDRGEVERLFINWRQSADPAFREQIICQHLYLVQAVARKFSGLGESPDDLISEGVMGLINAVDLFDPKRGVLFSTYATHLIDGQIRHYLRDKSKMIREPAWIQERLTRITRAAEAITHKAGRPAKLAEIADEIELSEAQVREALLAQDRTRVSSLDSVRASENDEGDSKLELQRLLTFDDGLAGLEVEDRLFLQQEMEKLKPLEQKVLHHFYYLDLNQTEIARKLGISVNYASYLLRGAQAKLKQAFETQTKVELEPTRPAPAELRGSGTSAIYSLNTPVNADLSTALASENYFRQALRQETLRASRYPQQFTLLLVEPDGAAQWGEERCSAVMQELCARMRKNIRMVDLAARVGRWRIGILLPHTGREVNLVAERLKQRAPADITLSVGIAVFPADGSNENILEERAEQALLKAQRNGGNQISRAVVPPPAAEKPQKTRRTRKKKASQPE